MAFCHHSSSGSSTAFPSPSLLDDDILYCEEEKLDDEERQEQEDFFSSKHSSSYSSSPFSDDTTTTTQQNLLFPQLDSDDCDSDSDILQSLLVKEQQIHRQTHYNYTTTSSLLSLARQEAVNWILKVNSHYTFTTLTAILSINYFDRFISLTPHFQPNQNTTNTTLITKPWLIHLIAVTCLSLAAKVEETDVPLLLDLQIEGTKYVFEAKTIQKMELLILSTLDWKMSAVTPVTFLDHLVRNLRLKSTSHPNFHWEFYRRCERVLLFAVADSRFVKYLPSVLATSTMMHVIHQMMMMMMDPTSTPVVMVDYQNQLQRLLNIITTSKDMVKDCYALIVEISSSSEQQQVLSSSDYYFYSKMMSNKRSRDDNDDDDLLLCNETAPPASPSGVIDAYFGSESSNESWSSSSSSIFSTSHSPFQRTAPPPFESSSLLQQHPGGRWMKKARVYEQYMRRLSSPSSTFSSSSSTSSSLGRRRMGINPH